MTLRLLPIITILATFCVANANAQVSDREYPTAGTTQLRLNVSGPVHLMPATDARSIVFHVVDFGPSVPAIRFTQTRLGRRMTISVTGPAEALLPFTGASGYELQVRYPSSMQLDLRQFAGKVQADGLVAASQIYDANGPISIAGALGPITAEADNGSIDLIDAHANVMLTSGNGAVEAQLAADWHGKLVRIESSNGALGLTVPAGFRARYDLTTSNGKVRNALRAVKGAPLVFMLTESGDVSVTSK